MNTKHGKRTTAAALICAAVFSTWTPASAAGTDCLQVLSALAEFKVAAAARTLDFRRTFRIVREDATLLAAITKATRGLESNAAVTRFADNGLSALSSKKLLELQGLLKVCEGNPSHIRCNASPVKK